MFFLIRAGTKTFRKYDGIAADFCAICRRISAIDVEEIRCQPHINHIGIGQGSHVGHMCRCRTCTTEWRLRPGTIQDVIAPALYSSMESLVQQTFPYIETVRAERLAEERIIQHDPFTLPATTRQAMIAEPFYLLANALEVEMGQSAVWQNLVGGLAGAGAVGLTVVACITLTDNSPISGILEICVAAGLGLLAIWISLSLTSKFMKRRVYPRLASCLAPLRPSQEELSQVLRSVNTKCAKRTKLNLLMPLLQNPA